MARRILRKARRIPRRMKAKDLKPSWDNMLAHLRKKAMRTRMTIMTMVMMSMTIRIAAPSS